MDVCRPAPGRARDQRWYGARPHAASNSPMSSVTSVAMFILDRSLGAAAMAFTWTAARRLRTCARAGTAAAGHARDTKERSDDVWQNVFTPSQARRPPKHAGFRCRRWGSTSPLDYGARALLAHGGTPCRHPARTRQQYAVSRASNARAAPHFCARTGQQASPGRRSCA